MPRDLTTVEYALPAARGVVSAHDKARVHCDLELQSTVPIADDPLKNLDFGLGRQSGGTASASDATAAKIDPGTVMGTVGNMAPKPARGVSVDGRTDPFGFVAVLYEMLTGRRVF